MERGKVGNMLSQLILNLRQVMEPNTATRLKVGSFTEVTAQLGSRICAPFKSTRTLAKYGWLLASLFSRYLYTVSY